MGKFKQQFTNVPGITDGIYDIGTILEENTKNVDHADVLNKYLENGTRLSTKYYSTKNITHFKNGVVDASQYIKYKREGYSGLVGLGYYPVCTPLFHITNESSASDITYTIKSGADGKLYVNDNLLPTLTRSNGDEYIPKLITLVVQAGGGAGGAGANTGVDEGGGGGGAGACVALELCCDSNKGCNRYISKINTTIATVTLGKRSSRPSRATDINTYPGTDCTITIGSQTITVGGGKGGYPTGVTGLGGDCGEATKPSSVTLNNVLLSYTVLMDKNTSGENKYGYGGTQPNNGYSSPNKAVAYAASPKAPTPEVSEGGKSGGAGVYGGGGGASLFSDGMVGMEPGTTQESYNSEMRKTWIGCGGGGGSCHFDFSPGVDSHRGFPGGVSALWIYY